MGSKRRRRTPRKTCMEQISMINGRRGKKMRNIKELIKKQIRESSRMV